MTATPIHSAGVTPLPAAATAASTLRAPQLGPQSAAPAPAPARGSPSTARGSTAAAVDGEHEIWDGISADRPLEIVPTVLTNAIENLTGTRDERYGKALTHVLLASERFVQAGLRHASRGNGVVATGSSVLGKVLPTLSIGMGAFQVWKGWNELQSHDDGPLSIIHSKTARSGMFQVAAGALLFIPGVGPAIGGALMRLGAAANEMDELSFLDWPTVSADQQGGRIAKVVHPFDRTPAVPGDRPAPAPGDDVFERAVDWVRAKLD